MSALSTPVVAAPGAPPAASDRWRAFARWGRRRAGRLAVALALLVLVVGAAIAYTERAGHPPDAPVRALFAALAARDGDEAGQLAGCVDSPLCSSAALRTGYRPPTDVVIGAVTYGDATDATLRPDKAIAYVAITYRLAGQIAPVTGSVQVERSRGGIDRPWSISAGGYGFLDVVSTVDPQAEVGGVTVPTVNAHQATTGLGGDLAAGAGNEAALPGVYSISGAGTDALFIASAPDAVVVGSNGRGLTQAEVTLTVEIRSTVLADVQRQVDASVDTCAAGADDTLHIGCPFVDPPAPAYHVSDDVTWHVTRYPVIGLKVSTDPAGDGGPITVYTVTPGVAVATWPRSSLEAAGTETDAIDPGGVVTASASGSPVYTN